MVAFAAGALVANLYYAQPLIASIGPEIGVSPELAGSIVSITQIGYGVGLFLLVSLADIIENRRLVLTMLAGTIIGLVAVASSTSAASFFVASFLIGLCSTGAQVLVPFIATLAPEGRRGRIVGNVMAGLLTGIMLARPIALFIAGSFGWRAVFWCAAALMILIGFILLRIMPRHEPKGRLSYAAILASMAGLFRTMPVLRERALYQSLMFAAFNILWTAVPLLLAQRFGMGQYGIALFALAGAGGALAAPIAGRLADRGLIRGLTAGAMAALAVSFFALEWAAAAAALVMLVLLAVVIDAAVQTNQVVSQRLIFAAPSEMRGRVNAIYMTINFTGGALGSLLGTMTYEWGGWNATSTAGGIIGLLLLAFFTAATLRGRRA